MKKNTFLNLFLVSIFLSASLASFSQVTKKPVSIGEGETFISPDRAGALDCPVNSIFSQPPVNFSDAYYSDEGTLIGSQNIFELFSGLTQNIGGITFWGVLYDGTDCYTPGADTFEISFYNDNAGAIGALFQTFTIIVTPTVTGSIVTGSAVLRFDVTLPSSVALTTGWVSVVKKNPTDMACTFAWVNTTTGDNMSVWNNFGGSYNYASDNMSFCLTGASQIPLSNWPIILGIFLISTFLVIRYRSRRLA
ncbi:MAG: hypothetical protein L3J66_07915 [Bacteroidales bacterium]|nr:hypothetical protein [Bacteroidales bacterium]